MYDTLEEINGAILHHGKNHNRVYLMQTEQNDWNSLIPELESIAREKSYDKILGRLPEEGKEVFQLNGYQVEAEIPGLYNGEKPGYFLADYLNEERSYCSKQDLLTIESVKSIALAANTTAEDSYFDLPRKLHVKQLTENDLFVMARLHESAFKSYPFPIDKVEYLLELLQRNHRFYGLFQDDELLVSAIIKIHEKESNVEIVDFVTHPDYNGQNLSYYLVQEIKEDIRNSEYKTIYSLVRATSYGLNITFSKHGFLLGGTLLNNTVIRDTMESMNVWYSN